MIANYGYRDGSGVYLISVDHDKCNGCGDCIEVCPNKVLELVTDPYEPLEEKQVVAVTEMHRKKIKYSCAPCKPTSGEGKPPCITICQESAITHSW